MKADNNSLRENPENIWISTITLWGTLSFLLFFVLYLEKMEKESHILKSCDVNYEINQPGICSVVEVNPFVTVFDYIVFFILNHTSSFSLGVKLSLYLFLIVLFANNFFNQKNSGRSIYKNKQALSSFLIIIGVLQISLSALKALIENGKFDSSFSDLLIWINGFCNIFLGFLSQQKICENGLILGLMKRRTWDKFESFYWRFDSSPYKWIGVDENKIFCDLYLTLKPCSTLMNKRKTIKLIIPLVEKEKITKLFLQKFNR